jgi:tetraacyldisaccharide 4'-kinase
MNLKKPKFWDYNKPNLFSYLLFPFSILLNFFQYIKKKSKVKQFVLGISILVGQEKHP